MLNDNSKEKRFGQQTSHDASKVGNHIIDTAVTPEAAPDPFQTEPPSSQNEEGRFRFLRPLAEGNLGIVSVALDTELNREIALKRIRHDLASKADYLERFAREAEVTGALEHPGVVPVYGYGKDDLGQLYYAMRLIRGEELTKKFQEYHASVANGVEPLNGLILRGLLRRLVEVCNTMAYAHSRGVVHRDLKPANLMVGVYGETLVVDWGLAKPRGTTVEFAQEDSQAEISAVEGPVEYSKESLSETRNGSIVGTPLYAPPEQLLGDLKAIDHRSDIYSLGIILYELLTGNPPMRRSTLAELTYAVTRGVIKKPRDIDKAIPKPLEAICLKAIKAKKTERYQSVLELRRDIERFLDDRPVSVYSESFSERALRWMRHHGPLVRAATVSLIIVAIVSILFAYNLRIAHDRQTKAKEDATRLLKIARETTDQLLLNAQQRLEDIPDAADVQELLLQDAAEAYGRIAEVATKDPALLRETASALSGLASIQKSLGKPQNAIESLRKSIEILSNLPGESIIDKGNALASAYVELSRIYSTDQQNLVDATNSVQSALKICRSLPQDNVQSLKITGQAKIQEAVIKFDESDELTAMELNKEAARTLQSALEKSRQESVGAGDELVAEIRHLLARALFNEAFVGNKSNKLSSNEVARLYGEAISQLEWVFERFPSRKKEAREYADAQRALAEHYTETGNLASAQSLYRESFQKAKTLHEKNPQQLDYKYSSILSLLGLASVDEERRNEYAEQAGKMANELLGSNAVKKRYRLTAAMAFIYQAQTIVDSQPEYAKALSARSRELIQNIPESNDDKDLLNSIQDDCEKVECQLLLDQLHEVRVEGLRNRLDELIAVTAKYRSGQTQYNVAAKISAACKTLIDNDGTSQAAVSELLEMSLERLRIAVDASTASVAEKYIELAKKDEDFSCLRDHKAEAFGKLATPQQTSH